jgi:hypothetical protein
MKCEKCGGENDGGAVKCPQCGADTAPASVNIPNYLAPSILATLFCCLPFGVAAIVYAAQVNSKIQAGDIEGARAAAKNARMWCWISFGVAVAGFALYALMTVVKFIFKDSVNC